MTDQIIQETQPDESNWNINGLTLQCGILGAVPAGIADFRGLPFLFPAGSEIGSLAAQGSEWDATLREIVTALLPQSDPIICEVGGNIGASFRQMYFAKPGGSFLIFEPTIRFGSFLKANVQLAGAQKVEVFPMAVGAEPGTITVYNGLTTGTSVTNHGAVDKQEVKMTTLDEVLALRDHPVHFIKIDTDGHDLEVLRGAGALLERHRPGLYFEHYPGFFKMTDAHDGLAWLQAQGYRDLVCLQPDGKLIGITQDPHQANAWSESHGYSDILTCAEGTSMKALLDAFVPVLEFEDPKPRAAGRVLELQRSILELQRSILDMQRIELQRSNEHMQKIEEQHALRALTKTKRRWFS